MILGLSIFKLCTYTYKNKQNFLINPNFRNFNTRKKDNINLDFTSLSLKQSTPNYLGPKLYKKLPNDIKNSDTLNIFRNNIDKRPACDAIPNRIPANLYFISALPIRRTGFRGIHA